MLRKDEEHEWKRSLAYVSRMCHRAYRSDSFQLFPIPLYEKKNNKQTLHLPTSQPFFLQKYPTNYCSNIFGIHVVEFVQESEVQ